MSDRFPTSMDDIVSDEDLEKVPDSLDAVMTWDDMAEIISHMFEPDADRREALTAYLSDRRGVHDVVAFYDDHGSFRSTEPLTDEEREIVDLHVDHREAQNCYYNAQTAMIAALDDSLRYAEGYAVMEESPAPVPHAWVEVNGKVCDITPTGGDPATDVYYGVAYDAQTTRDAMLEDGQCDPLAERPDDYPPLENAN